MRVQMKEDDDKKVLERKNRLSEIYGLEGLSNMRGVISQHISKIEETDD